MFKGNSMQNDILIKTFRDPLFGLTRDQYIEKLKKTLSGRVKRAYIFGSFTTNSFNSHSDIDIILVVDTEKPFTQRNVDFIDLLDIVPSTDILVYTENEFNSIMNEKSIGFWKSVKESIMRIL